MMISNVNFNLYKSFIAVYEAKNISRAAAMLQITQPTVTYNIKELERQLDAKLFHTHPRGVEPTREADMLFKFVAEGVTSIANGENLVREFNEESIHALKIVAASFISKSLAQVIAEFNQEFPKVQYEITYDLQPDGPAKLAQHHTDVIITTQTIDRHKNLATINLCNTRRIGLASREFIAKYNLTEKVTFKDLEELPLVVFDYDKNEFPKFTAIVESESLMINLIKHGVGIGICLAEQADGLDDFVTLEITDALEIPVNCIYNRDTATKATKTFIRKVCEVFGAEYKA